MEGMSSTERNQQYQGLASAGMGLHRTIIEFVVKFTAHRFCKPSEGVLKSHPSKQPNTSVPLCWPASACITIKSCACLQLTQGAQYNKGTGQLRGGHPP